MREGGGGDLKTDNDKKGVGLLKHISFTNSKIFILFGRLYRNQIRGLGLPILTYVRVQKVYVIKIVISSFAITLMFAKTRDGGEAGSHVAISFVLCYQKIG